MNAGESVEKRDCCTVGGNANWYYGEQYRDSLKNWEWNYHEWSVLSRFSQIQFFVTIWVVAHQAPLSMGFCRQEHWSELPCPPPGDLPDPGIKPASPAPPASQADSLHRATAEAPKLWCDPVIPLLGMYPEKTVIEKDKCTPVFFAALFIIAMTWKQPRCLSTDEWIKKLWYLYTNE